MSFLKYILNKSPSPLPNHTRASRNERSLSVLVNPTPEEPTIPGQKGSKAYALCQPRVSGLKRFLVWNPRVLRASTAASKQDTHARSKALWTKDLPLCLHPLQSPNHTTPLTFLPAPNLQCIKSLETFHGILLSTGTELPSGSSWVL